MEHFLEQHKERIEGVISGFDRILFQGTLGSISDRHGAERWLWYQGVLLTGFSAFAEKLSTRPKKTPKKSAKIITGHLCGIAKAV